MEDRTNNPVAAHLARYTRPPRGPYVGDSAVVTLPTEAQYAPPTLRPAPVPPVSTTPAGVYVPVVHGQTREQESVVLGLPPSLSVQWGRLCARLGAVARGNTDASRYVVSQYDVFAAIKRRVAATVACAYVIEMSRAERAYGLSTYATLSTAVAVAEQHLADVTAAYEHARDALAAAAGEAGEATDANTATDAEETADQAMATGGGLLAIHASDVR